MGIYTVRQLLYCILKGFVDHLIEKKPVSDNVNLTFEMTSGWHLTVFEVNSLLNVYLIFDHLLIQ